MYFIILFAYLDLGPLVCAYWDFYPTSYSCRLSMPPKLRKHELRAEEASGDSGFSVSSPLSVASASAVGHGMMMSAEQLQLVLEANNRSMIALMEKSSSTAAHVPVVSSEHSHLKTSRVDIPKWVDGESPSEFFSKYEQALTHNGVDRGKWGSLLQIYLSGSAQASFSQVNPAVLNDYDQVKKEMLESLGDTPDGADKRWFNLSRQRGETHRALYRRVHNTGFRRMYGMETKEQCCMRMILSKFLSLLSPECYSSVVAKRPVDGQEAAKFAQQYEEDTAFAKSLQLRPNGSHNSFYKREQGSFVASNSQGGSSGTSGSKGGTSSQVGGSNSPSPAQSQGPSSNQVNVDKGSKQEKYFKKERKPITCYGCGEAGHIRPNCPNKVRRVKSPEHSNVMVVNGWLAGCEVQNLRVDTGADRTIVRQDFIPEEAYTGEMVRLDSWRGAQFSSHRVACITIKVGTVEVTTKVAVVDHLDCPALLGSDLGIPLTKEMMRKVVAQLEENQSVPSEEGKVSEVMESVPIRSTRAQVEREREREKENEIASARAECTPTPLSEVFDFPDSYFEQDPVPTPVAELCTWPEDGVADLPLPSVGSSDSDKLVREQQEDSTLKKVLQLALSGEKGYAFDNDVLVQYSVSSSMAQSRWPALFAI